MTKGPIRDLSTFADSLRRRGMTVTPDQVGNMARSVSLVDPANRNQLKAAWRTLAITDPSQRSPFDDEFNQFFDQYRLANPTAEQHSNLHTVEGNRPILLSVDTPESEDIATQMGASAVETIATRDFAELDETDIAKARSLVMKMLWQPTDVKTRRWIQDARGRRPDMRRTLREATGPEGDLLRIEMRRRRLRQRPLIVLADISGSMESYAELFLVFTHAASQRLRHVEAFTFSTRLTRITEDLKRRSTGDALALAAETVTDWSGGTKIGESIQHWNSQWSRRMARSGPVVMILSDGWDCGDPKLLATEMGRLARSVHKVIWLNPLAGRADYRPATQGMKAALPHIDHLLPAASVQDLRGVVRLLESIAGTV